jgi:hypothetical protein
MKKSFLLVNVILLVIMLVGARINELYQLKNILDFASYYHSCQTFTPFWDNTELGEHVEITLKDGNALLFRVNKNNSPVGYFILQNQKNEINVIVTSFDTVDPILENDDLNYFVAPFSFLNKTDFDKIKVQPSTSEKVIKKSFEPIKRRAVTLNTSKLIHNSNSVVPYYESYTSYISLKTLMNVPDYFQPESNYCAPSAAAMLVSYYDHTTLENLVSGDLPLEYDPTNSNLINLMSDLATRMNWTSSGGTQTTDIAPALTSYFAAHSNSVYKGQFAWSGSNTIYSNLVSQDATSAFMQLILSKNPSIVITKVGVSEDSPTDGNAEGHVCFGYGFQSIRYVGNEYLVKMGYPNSNGSGNYALDGDYILQVNYLAKN